MKEVYLVRHSAPFVSIKTDENVKWSDFNRNMILVVFVTTWRTKKSR